MADFSSGISPVQEQAPRPIIAPPDTSTANNISAFGSILGTVGATLAQGSALNTQLQLKQKQDSALMNYSEDLLRISDLQQQGVLKTDSALRQFRLRTASMLANHPAMQDEIFKTFGNIVEKAGLGKNVVDSYQNEQDIQKAQQQQMVLDATKAGFIQPGMTNEQQQQAIGDHQQFLFGQTQMEQADKLLNHKKNEVELTNAQLQTTAIKQGIANQSITIQRNRLGLADDQAKFQFRAGAQNVVDGYFNTFQGQLNDIQRKVGTQQPDPSDPTGQKTILYTPTMATQDIDNAMQQVQRSTAKLAIAYDSQGTLEAFTKPMEMLANTAKQNVSGALDKTQLQNQIDNAVALKQLHMINSNDDLLGLTAASKLLPATASSLQEAVGHKFTDIMKQNGMMPGDTNVSPKNSKPGDPTSNGDAKHDSDLRNYFGIVRAGMSTVASGAGDKGVKQDTDAHFGSILAGVGKYGPTAASPSELKDVVNFMASSQVGQYIKANPQLMQGQNAALAQNVYKQDYQQVVLPLVQQEFLNSNVAIDNKSTVTGRGIRLSDPTMAPSNSAIHPEFNGTGVTFVANDPTKGETNREAQRLNRDVAPIMNQLIQASAHFQGDTNYQKQYDAMMQQLGDGMNSTRSDQGGSGGGGGGPTMETPAANPKQASAATPATGATDYEHMSHADLLNMRAKLKPDDPQQNVLAQYEHQAFAREWVKENPAVATASLLAGIPLYTAGKEAGAIHSRSKPSLDEMAAAYRGVGQGLGLVD